MGLALSKKAVERIYKLRRRNPKKPMIILISSLNDLNLFGIKLTNQLRKILNKFWPGKVSIILPCPSRKFYYLHRGKKSLAFRLPKKPALIKLLIKTGPLVAPSANPEGLEVAKDIQEAKRYFDNPSASLRIDFYADAGKLTGLPSTLIQIKNNEILIKREGAVKLCPVVSPR